MASESGGSDINSRHARFEKRSIEYMDNFIDTRKNQHGSDYLIPLVSFQGHVACGSNEIRTYIGHRKKEVEEFITRRPYCWTVRANNGAEDRSKMLIVEKQPQEVRAAVVRVLAYVQRKTEEAGQGAKLNNISVLIGQHHPTIKRFLGVGLQGVKTFLLGFSTLFQMVEDGPTSNEPGDILFKNRAVVVDGVILPPALEGQPNPLRLDGMGPVVRLFPTYGFIRDEKTKQDAYFTVQALRDLTEQDFRRLAADGEKFIFEAYISREYESGKTSNKWSVFQIWPPLSDGRISVASGSSSGIVSGSGSTVSSTGLDQPQISIAQSATKPKADIASASVYDSNLMASLEEDLDELSVDNPKYRSDNQKFAAGQSKVLHSNCQLQKPLPVPKAKAAAPIVSARDQVKKKPAPAKPSSNMAVTTGVSAKAKRALSVEGVKRSANVSLDSDDTQAPSLEKKPIAVQAARAITSKSAPRSQEVNNVSSSARLFGGGGGGGSSSVNAKGLEKREAACQTEFNDERELLLRLLRQSPDLLKLVRAVRCPDD